MDRLAEIEQRVQAATPGPWVSQYETICQGAMHPDGDTLLCGGGWEPYSNFTKDDCAFIAHAREDVPRLLIQVRYLLARIRALEAGLAACSEVRWITDHEGDNRCALCRAYQDSDDHAADCTFMVARAALAGES